MNQHSEPHHVIIVGAGFGGLCMGATLRTAGIENFLILEKAATLGGTWRDNSYPGAECDVPSALYSYSFAPNPTWNFKWSKQAQILDYLQRFAADRSLLPHLRYGHEVSAARFDPETALWTVQIAGGDRLYCRHLVCALGQLHHPAQPALPGAGEFRGPAFHSAEWRHDVDLAGQRVAVIGNAASAIQLIPELARVAAEVTVYQRSANWMLPKGDRPYSAIEKRLARWLPGLFRLYRFGIWCKGEFLLYPIIRGWWPWRRLGEWMCQRSIRQHIADPALREALLPDYPIGAKRILLSDNYYPTLARDNVELVTAAIERLDADGIVSADGRHRSHDVIVYATGFHTNPFLQSIEVSGVDGRLLHDHWRDGAHAYLGVMTAGFPNLFMLYGPNTNQGHTSVVQFLEAQCGYIRQLLERAGSGSVEVRADAETAFNGEIQRRLQDMVWNQVDASWYKSGGRITNNWPGSSIEYRRRLRHPNWRDFRVLPAAAPARATPRRQAA